MLRDKNSYAANPLKIFANSKICAVDFLYNPLKNYKKISKISHDIDFNTFNVGRGGEIRTPDPLVPNQMRYQAALRPE